MKKQFLVMGALCSILFLGTFNWSSCTAKKTATVTTPEPAMEEKVAEEPPSVPPFIAAIQEKIKGKENLPAEEVFENTQILKGMPAGRVLPIMRMGFSQSLGVACVEHHGGTRLGQAARQRQADAGGGAGDQGHAPVKAEAVEDRFAG